MSAMSVIHHKQSPWITSHPLQLLYTTSHAPNNTPYKAILQFKHRGWTNSQGYACLVLATCPLVDLCTAILNTVFDWMIGIVGALHCQLSAHSLWFNNMYIGVVRPCLDSRMRYMAKSHFPTVWQLFCSLLQAYPP